jgi:AhpD family alkylhydroperoxidase
VPNFFRVLSNSPAVINAHAALNQGLGKALDLKTRERIALAVAAVNGCEYCDAAHTFTGYTFAKLSKEEVDLPGRALPLILMLQRPRLCSQGSRGSGQGFGRRHRGDPPGRFQRQPDRGNRGRRCGEFLHQPDQQRGWHGRGFPSI